MADTRASISAVVICFNEEENIRECLASLAWVDDLVVVDSESTDSTAEIAGEFTERVIERPWPGFVEQKNFAVEQAEHDWVLSVDADEVVTPELRDEICELLSSGNEFAAGYSFPRRTFYLGRWIRHGGWYPDSAIRLFQKSKGRFVGDDPHDRVEVVGDVGHLDNDLVHFNYKNISDHLATVDRFSSVSARVMHEKGKRASLLKLTFKPPVKFFETYIWKLGILDGMAGFVIAVISSYYMFLKFAKLWEMQRVTAVRPKIIE
ncbi:MAG: glycosyltransferase family 2 protein [Planctomycetota bacterium]|jgi:glycosyltransferase involved in cell wall biosynthesis|nr:glycosyltransferase family 2 protein [Planctomycetota bacterium]MDP7253784.1 glycosyltransferase family 2 protein [Planctomycetota bacterium]